MLQVIHRSLSTFLIKQVGLTRFQAHTGTVTLIRRFGSAANLNIHPCDLFQAAWSHPRPDSIRFTPCTNSSPESAPTSS